MTQQTTVSKPATTLELFRDTKSRFAEFFRGQLSYLNELLPAMGENLEENPRPILSLREQGEGRFTQIIDGASLYETFDVNYEFLVGSKLSRGIGIVIYIGQLYPTEDYAPLYELRLAIYQRDGLPSKFKTFLLRSASTGQLEFDADGFVDAIIPENRLTETGWMEHFAVLHQIGLRLEQLVAKYPPL